MAIKKNNIFFFKEGVSFRLPSKETLQLWLSKEAGKEGCSISNINFIFCSDKLLKKMNRQYLHHDFFTDIITFDNSSTESAMLEGDIFISIDTVRKNSKKFGSTFNDELCRVMAHGVLHLIGYDDKNPKQYDKMKQLEDKWLRGLK